jgi:ABC-type uncharacterized transport system permease subunit
MDLTAITQRGLAELGPMLLVLILLSALFLHWGTAIAGMPGRAYYKALLSLVATAILLGLVATATSVVSPLGGVVAGVGVIIATKLVYQTDVWRALVACVVGSVLTAVLVFLVASALSGKG